MSTFLVTFKLAQNATVAERHDSLIDQLDGNEWWAETGSTVVVNDDASIDDFCNRVFRRSKLDASTDVAVVFDLDTRDARAHGSFVDYGLFHIVPWLEKV